MEEASQWYQDREADWEAQLNVLRSEGWVVKVTSIAAPFQLEGRLPTEEGFYFRSRHDEASLAVGGDDPAGSPKWEGSERYGSAEDASFLPGEEGLALLRLLVAAYRDTSTSPPSP